MSLRLDAALEAVGTRFRIFVQPRFMPGFDEPETIRVSVPPDKIQPGPADERMYVLDAVNKRPYGRRPFLGDRNPPVEPGPDGHFDHLGVDSRAFSAATMYATVRRVLDIWEDFFGRRIEWHFRLDFERLELIPLINWDNAQSGYGFLEFGFGRSETGAIDFSRPYCQNFDVLAHELGHSLIFAEVGIPNRFTETDEYGGFHESAGDLVAIVSSLHFDKLADTLLQHSRGNLFTVNELARVGELSDVRQIRNAFNYQRMSTVSTEPHDLSQPLTGAMFDVMVEVYQKNLVAAGLISQELADRSYHGPDENIDDREIQEEFAHAFEGKAGGFKTALLQARDSVGLILAHAWDNLSPDFLSYLDAGLALLDADQALSAGSHRETIRDCFSWREITLPEDSIALRPRRVTEYCRV
jgi:hypothetical protein